MKSLISDKTIKELLGSQIPAGVSGTTGVLPKIEIIPAIDGKRPFNFDQQGGYYRGQFISSNYDLSEVGKIEDTESMVRQSFKKKTDLMFKEGFSFSGANKATVRYIKRRLAQIERASLISTRSLLKRLASSLIRVSNAFLIKVRDDKKSGGKIRIVPGKKSKLQPVAAYFPAAPETMQVELDPVTGRIVKWRQYMPSGLYKEYRPDDVVHFTLDRREGFTFGVPSIIPVIDDIRALRTIEENIEMLLYQHLFPLFHYKVGTETAPAGYTEEGNRELAIVKEQVRMMPSEGAIVTPERHEIKAIGTDGRAIRAEGYLTHFKKRVISGLGVSSVDLGEGDSTNKATAFTLSRALVDSVKAIQDDFETQFNLLVISELLLESTFSFDTLAEENMVNLSFAEIDLANKIEREKHAVEMFKANGLTWDELRVELGREPIMVPEDPNDQDPSKYPEWFNTNWKLFHEPEQLIRAVDEPWSLAAQAAAEARSLSTTTQHQQRAAQEADKAAQKQPDNRDRSDRVRKQQDSIQDSEHFKFHVSTMLSRLQKDLSQSSSLTEVVSHAANFGDNLKRTLSSFSIMKYSSAYNKQFVPQAEKKMIAVSDARQILNRRIEFFVDKMITDFISLQKSSTDSVGSNNKNDIIHKDISLITRKVKYIIDTELKKAHFFGMAISARDNGKTKLVIQSHNNSCEDCKSKHNFEISLETLTIDQVPPFHPFSRTFVIFK